MDTPLDPYRDWLGIEEKQRPLTLYQLLQLDPSESRTERIEQAVERQIAKVQKFVSGPNARLARRTLYEIESAKQCLLDPATKRSYDAGSVAKVVSPATAQIADVGPLELAPLLPPRIDSTGPDAPALDELAHSSVASLFDEALPAVEEQPSIAANLAALGIVPKPARSARSEATKKIAVVVLLVAIPLSFAGGLLWFAIRWFDGPGVAIAARETTSDGTVAGGAGAASAKSAAPRNASQVVPPQSPESASQPADSPTATSQPAPNSIGFFPPTVLQPALPQAVAPGGGSGAVAAAPGQAHPAFAPASAFAKPSISALPRHGSLLGPSSPSAYSRTVVEIPRSLSLFAVDLDKEVTNLPIDDERVPKASAAVLEILELRGFPTEPEMSPGPSITEGSKPLRLILRAADPRVEIRMKISGARGERMLSIRPVIVDGGAEGPAISFTNDRVNTMSAKLPGEFEAAREKFNAVCSDGRDLELEITRLSNIPLNNATEAANRDYAIRTAQERLRRLAIQRTNLEHAAARLEYRLAQLPALVALKAKIDHSATIRFRVIAEVDGHQIELLEKAPVRGP